LQNKLPLAELIQSRLQQLCLTPQALGSRLGYSNPAKAAGRVYALCEGHLDNRKSRVALTRLPAALELPTEVVEQAVLDTRLVIAKENWVAQERARIEQEAREAEWRRTFRPHAVILAEKRIPDQITFCGLTGGPEVRLIIPFDLCRPAVTFVAQATAGLEKKVPIGRDGRRKVPFFGAATGLVINYSPDIALRCNLEGSPIEWLSAARRLGQIELSLGSRIKSPHPVARVLGLQ
jgi:hypothetical protein